MYLLLPANMYDKFSFVLMVDSPFRDLRCGYCYVGRKSASTMSAELGHAGPSNRAVQSVRSDGKFERGSSAANR